MTANQQDLLLILDYIDGRLSTQEMLRAELRFSNDPELGAACESFAAMDALQRELSRSEAGPLRSSGPTHFLRGGLGLVSAAAAVLLVVCAGLYITRDRSMPNSMRVVVLRSDVGVAGFNRELQLGPDWLAVDPSQVRGAGDADVDARAYFEHVAPIQEQRLEATLEGAGTITPMTYFSLVLKPAEPCSAIVLLMESDGVVVDAEGLPFGVAFPAQEAWNVESGRLQGGSIAVLPRRNLTWDSSGDGRPIYDPGFLVRGQSGTVLALVGLRAAALDDVLRGALGSKLQELSARARNPLTTADALRAWLREEGFALQEFLIEEER